MGLSPVMIPVLMFSFIRAVSPWTMLKNYIQVGDGEAVDYDVVLVPRPTPEAVNVTGPNGTRVQGSIYSPDRLFPYPASVVHAAMKAYGDFWMNWSSRESAIKCHGQWSPWAWHKHLPRGTICGNHHLMTPTKPAFDYTSYG